MRMAFWVGRVVAVLCTFAVAVTLFVSAQENDGQQLAETIPRLVDLGTLGGSFSYAAGVNERGEVVGHSTIVPSANYETPRRPFLWSAATGMRDLGTLGGHDGIAVAINNRGHVAGASVNAHGEYHAFIWSPEQGMRDLGALEGTQSEALGLNDSDQVVGYYLSASFDQRCFLWSEEGGMLDIGTLGGPSCIANGINNRGEVVGGSTAEAGGPVHAFVWTHAGDMTDRGILEGSHTFAAGVNSRGDLVGYTAGITAQGFMWTPTTGLQTVGSLGESTNTWAYALNDRRQVVGESFTSAGEQRGFLLSTDIGMIPLPTLGGAHGGAWGINQQGDIAGWAQTISNEEHAVIWLGSAL